MPGWLSIIICGLGAISVMILCGTVNCLKYIRAQGMGRHFLGILGHTTKNKITNIKNKQTNKLEISQQQYISTTVSFKSHTRHQTPVMARKHSSV